MTMDRSLSKNEAKVVLGLEWNRRSTVRLTDLRAALGAPASDGYLRFVAHRLVQKGWLERLRPGLYHLIPAERGIDAVADTNPLSAGAELASPSYFSYGTACTHHGLTDQVFGETYIACMTRRRPVTVRDTRYVFVHVPADRFFGFGPVMVFGEPVQMATLERALLDAIDHPEFSGGIGEVAHIVARASSRVSWDGLLECGARMRSSAILQRLGCLLDVQRAELPPSARRGLEGLIHAGSRIFLAPKGRWGTAGQVQRPWNVVVNVPPGLLEPSPGRRQFEYKRAEPRP
jgi:predicted transcriptional regulator of viral defense system